MKFASLICLLVACSSSGPSSAPDAGVTLTPVDAGPFAYQTCDPAARVGQFSISLESTFTAVSGKIASSVDPMLVPMLIEDAGACRLIARPNPFCDPACGTGTTCGAGGKCVPVPVPRSAGPVAIFGLSAPLMIAPSPMYKQYNYNKLPHPGFAPGADIQLRAAGDELPPFVLLGWGITPLSLTTDATVLQMGKDLTVQWTAGPTGPARIAIELQIDQHGHTPATLACEVPDTGSAIIPASLIDHLIMLGTTGFPAIRVTRRTVDAAMVTGGCVELQVSSTVDRAISVAGHDPCSMAMPSCPAGKTCDVMAETCR